MRTSRLSYLALLIAGILVTPILSVIWTGLAGDAQVWQHLQQTVLSEYLLNSFYLSLGVAVGVLLIGVPTAWLTSVFEFPGKRYFIWLLLLPLAMPAYIIAYTYTGVLDAAGPVQTFIREMTGLSYGEYWFFEIRSLGGAIAMLILVLYPYVYLLARVAFLEQSVSSLEVSRTLGYSVSEGFYRVAIPLARPAIIAGLILALMETLADYGTVQYFGVSTFTTGIFRTFYGFGDDSAASQLAMTLLSFVVLLIVLERYMRRMQRYYSRNTAAGSGLTIQLQGYKKYAAWLICALPVFLGFLLPAGIMLHWTTLVFEYDSRYFELVANSFYVSIITASLVVIIALILVYAKRLSQQRWIHALVSFVGMGYALPGTIIAIGLILPLSWLDMQIRNMLQAGFDITWPILLSASVFAMVFAYSVRFSAVALGSIESGMQKISPHLDDAGRLLGYRTLPLGIKVHLPLLTGSMLTAFLIVFVDVMKELPATLILRPFNFNTLAVRAFELASDERLQETAPVSLTIVLIGLIPVILLSRSIQNSATRKVILG